MTTCSNIPACKIHGQRSLVGYSPWGRKESDMHTHPTLQACHPWPPKFKIKKSGVLANFEKEMLWDKIFYFKIFHQILYSSTEVSNQWSNYSLYTVYDPKLQWVMELLCVAFQYFTLFSLMFNTLLVENKLVHFFYCHFYFPL